MRKTFTILTILVLIINLLTSCEMDNIHIKSNDKTSAGDSIYINGNVEETVEVNTEFIDPGVLFPNQYTLVVEGEVNTAFLGRTHIKYFVYSNSGELVKELNRFVNVVDTTPPTYTEISSNGEVKYYIGYKYTLEDFITDYEDNYISKKNIVVTPTEFEFETEGLHEINITFTDTTGNSSSYTKKITVEKMHSDTSIDFEALIRDVYKDQLQKISSGTTGTGSNYIRVRVDENTSFSCYDSNSIHYIQTVTTKLGTRASIQISAPYGEFDEANISYHISGANNKYSVGFATIDATNELVSVPHFNSTINDLSLEEETMLKELNDSILSVLNNFKKYMNNTLKLPFC